MTNKNSEVSRGDGGASLPSPKPGPPDHLRSRGSNGNTIFKSGPLSISSKGIGWTSWKKRWFILTRTSLVFFRSDPSVVPQKGSEANLTLGGIDLNNSGSVVVKADKKLLTVLFPDGRAFTLKAETTEDLHEWKTALENALGQAPSAATLTGQNGIFRNDQTDSIDISLDQSKEIEPIKSTVIGRPILLALEDVDGDPSILEKALRFIEEHGIKVEGILRQAADVDDVENRVREYEQGKVEFSAEEDAHVVADCLKHVLRELPSSPVPASCCKALLEACRTERASRVSAIRAAVCDTFPEPNRRLLQRILQMMQKVASHKAVNRMSSSAVAACMAPLLLRPLLAGECEIESDFDVGGDGSMQLLQAATAANHAQTIIITLLEEYDSIFGEGTVSPDIYNDSEESGSESEEATDNDESYDEDDYDDECDESIQESDADADDDLVSETCSETEDSGGNDVHDDKDHDHSSSDLKSCISEDPNVKQTLSSNSLEVSLPQQEDMKNSENLMSPIKTVCAEKSSVPADIVEGVSTDQSTVHNSNFPSITKSITISNGPAHAQCRTVWGRTSAMKNLSMESVDYPTQDEAEIETLEAIKAELQNLIAEEAKGNAKLQSYLEKRRKALHERHLALEQDVARLQEHFQKKKNSQETIEAGLKFPPGSLSNSTNIDEKTKTDLEELALVEADLTKLQRQVDDLGVRLKLQREQNYGSALDFCNQPQQISDPETKLKNKLNTEVAATSQLERTRSKDTQFGVAERENERKLEYTTLPKYQTCSKGSGTKGEAANSPTSTLTKLTTRLNYLKERYSQVTNEFQNAHRGSLNSLKGKGFELLSLPSPNKSRGSEIPSVSNPEKGRASDSSQSLQIPDKGSGKEGKPLQNTDKLRKSDSQSDKRNQHQQYLERGRSEGHQSYNVDKGR